MGWSVPGEVYVWEYLFFLVRLYVLILRVNKWHEVKFRHDWVLNICEKWVEFSEKLNIFLNCGLFIVKVETKIHNSTYCKLFLFLFLNVPLQYLFEVFCFIYEELKFFRFVCFLLSILLLLGRVETYRPYPFHVAYQNLCSK